MTQELLKGTDDIHLYFHDAEALFCIELLMLTCHMVGRGEGVGNHTRGISYQPTGLRHAVPQGSFLFGCMGHRTSNRL